MWFFIFDNLVWCIEVMEVDWFGEVMFGIVLVINGCKKYLLIFKFFDFIKNVFFRS